MISHIKQCHPECTNQPYEDLVKRIRHDGTEKKNRINVSHPTPAVTVENISGVMATEVTNRIRIRMPSDTSSPWWKISEWSTENSTCRSACLFFSTALSRAVLSLSSNWVFIHYSVFSLNRNRQRDIHVSHDSFYFNTLDENMVLINQHSFLSSITLHFYCCSIEAYSVRTLFINRNSFLPLIHLFFLSFSLWSFLVTRLYLSKWVSLLSELFYHTFLG